MWPPGQPPKATRRLIVKQQILLTTKAAARTVDSAGAAHPTRDEAVHGGYFSQSHYVPGTGAGALEPACTIEAQELPPRLP
jgi:hypothetical protein